VNAAGEAAGGGLGAGTIVLIGMPGAGKSTVGVLIAKRLGLGFVDTDILIQERAGRRLQHILDDAGYRELRRLEEEARAVTAGVLEARPERFRSAGAVWAAVPNVKTAII